MTDTPAKCNYNWLYKESFGEKSSCSHDIARELVGAFVCIEFGIPTIYMYLYYTLQLKFNFAKYASISE